MVTFFAIKNFEMRATGETFTMLCLEGMTANISWLPHLAKIRNIDDQVLNIDFGNLKTPIPMLT